MIDPATGIARATLWLATESDIDAAAENSVRDFAEWSALTPLARAGILKTVADAMRRDSRQMAEMLTSEQGKTIREARGEVAGSADLLEWLAEEGKRVYGRVVSARSPDVQQLVLLEPVGNAPCLMIGEKLAAMLRAEHSDLIR